ncbi:hypothetical protein L0Y46_04955, partial [bacterium]|nr:hypothetical protein [bacterium]
YHKVTRPNFEKMTADEIRKIKPIEMLNTLIYEGRDLVWDWRYNNPWFLPTGTPGIGDDTTPNIQYGRYMVWREMIRVFRDATSKVNKMDGYDDRLIAAERLSSGGDPEAFIMFGPPEWYMLRAVWNLENFRDSFIAGEAEVIANYYNLDKQLDVLSNVVGSYASKLKESTNSTNRTPFSRVDDNYFVAYGVLVEAREIMEAMRNDFAFVISQMDVISQIDQAIDHMVPPAIPFFVSNDQGDSVFYSNLSRQLSDRLLAVQRDLEEARKQLGVSK